MPADTSEAELLALVDRLNADPAVDGILVQLPLPAHIDANKVITRDRPRQGRRRLPPGQRRAAGDRAATASSPARRSAASSCSSAELGDLSGKTAVVIGRSNIVGKPMALLLLGDSCTVTIAHSRTRDLPDVVRRADIVVAAVGRPEMVKGDWLKPGATVIDVGINRTDAGLVGDVDFASASRGRRRDHPGAGRGRADDHRLPASATRWSPPRGARALRCEAAL